MRCTHYSFIFLSSQHDFCVTFLRQSNQPAEFIVCGPIRLSIAGSLSLRLEPAHCSFLFSPQPMRSRGRPTDATRCTTPSCSSISFGLPHYAASKPRKGANVGGEDGTRACSGLLGVHVNSHLLLPPVLLPLGWGFS